MSVKRYDCKVFYGHAEGGFVLHSDYAALEARHNALREAVTYYINCLDYATNHEAVIMARAEVVRLLKEA